MLGDDIIEWERRRKFSLLRTNCHEESTCLNPSRGQVPELSSGTTALIDLLGRRLIRFFQCNGYLKFSFLAVLHWLNRTETAGAQGCQRCEHVQKTTEDYKK